MEAETDARLLLEYAGQMDRTAFFLKSMQEAPADTVLSFRALIRKRESRMPLQHILGFQEFMGFEFHCDARALVPRQDTEILAENALAILKSRMAETEDNAGHDLRVLDLCTGSGCIGISLKLLCPDAEVVCSDISDDALELAKENADKLGAEVELRRSDLMNDIPGKFDLILSNPPYIREDVIDTLQTEVCRFDPRMALSGGEDGLIFYRRICSDAPEKLREGGYLLFEIGSDQAEEVRALMKAARFSALNIIKDLGGNDRVVLGQMRNHHV